MKAAIYLGKESIEIRELPLPEVGDGDVLIQNIYSSICGTDHEAPGFHYVNRFLNTMPLLTDSKNINSKECIIQKSYILLYMHSKACQEFSDILQLHLLKHDHPHSHLCFS